jgi:hypothetical protein
VDVAVDVAQGGGPQGDTLDHPADAVDLDGVADGVLALGQQEQTVEQVLDHGLGAEAHREAEHPGRGQQRPRVDAHHRQAGHHSHRHQHGHGQVAEDVEERLQAAGIGDAAPGGQRRGLQMGLHPVEHDPHQADGHHRAEDGEDEPQALVPGKALQGVADAAQ